MVLRSLLPPAAALCAVALMPSAAALADEPVGASAEGTSVVADAGYAAWTDDGGRVVVQVGGRAPKTTALEMPPGSTFDVGARRAARGGQLVWAERCSKRSHTCAVRAAQLTAASVATGRLSTQTIARVPYRGGATPAVAVDGARIAYTVRYGSCDVPFVRTLPTSSAHRRDRGACATLTQLDLGEGHLALLAEEEGEFESYLTEARVLKLSGGRSRRLQRESASQETNFIGSVSLDRGALYVARGGKRQANVVTRFKLASGARSIAHAFASLTGAYAIDGGRTVYVESRGAPDGECETEAGTPACFVVTGSDPFGAGGRRLVPSVAVTVTPQPVFTDSAPTAVATITRKTVTRSSILGTAPVTGVTVELLVASRSDPQTGAPTGFAPTGARAVTDRDGDATIPIPGTPPPWLRYDARTVPAAGGLALTAAAGPLDLQTYVHLSAAAQRLPSGLLRVTGTISPALPGRKVRLDRRLERACGKNAVAGERVPSPATTAVPAGCTDRWSEDAVATVKLSADGSTYTLEATTPAGSYRVSTVSAGDAPAYAGEAVVQAP
jgi:hypothetical protein